MNPESMIADASALVPPELITLGLALTALSGTFYFVWGFIGPMISWVKERVFHLMYREIEIHVSNPEYVKFNSWLEKNHGNTYFQRMFKVAHTWGPMDEYDDWDSDSEDDNDETGSGAKLVAGFGSVFIKKPGLPLVVVTRQKEEAKQVFKETETLTFKLFSITEAPIHRFFAEVTKIREEKGPFVYAASHSYWSVSGRPKTVMPPLGEGAQQFIDGVGKFLERKEEYKRKGVAYKIGFNLTGEPGTGKSSIVAHVANKYGLHVYLLNSESIAKFDDLRDSIKKRSIILIEDIDMTVAGNRRDDLLGDDVDPNDNKQRSDAEAANKIITQETIRDFLNALDGICEFSDAIIVSTTNKPDALDPALIRPGRLDSSIEIGKYTYKEQIQHINRFYGVELNIEDYTHIKDRTVAELQFVCTANMNDVDATLKVL